MPYIGPFQLFLIANVLFFAMQSLTEHEHRLVDARLSSSQSGLAVPSHNAWYRTVWRRCRRLLICMRPSSITPYVLHAKSFIILMVLPFAILLPIMFYRNRQPFVAHAVFSLHFYAFLLLLFCVSLAVVAVDVLLGGAGLNSARMDNVLSLINLAACATYLYIATGTVYGASGAIRVIKVLALALAVAGILLGYRFVLFLVTLYTT